MAELNNYILLEALVGQVNKNSLDGAKEVINTYFKKMGIELNIDSTKFKVALGKMAADGKREIEKIWGDIVVGEKQFKVGFQKTKKGFAETGTVAQESHKQVEEFQKLNNLLDEKRKKTEEINRLSFSPEKHEKEIEYEQEALDKINAQIDAQEKLNAVTDKKLLSQIETKKEKITKTEEKGTVQKDDIDNVREIKKAYDEFNFALGEYQRLSSDAKRLDARKFDVEKIQQKADDYKRTYEQKLSFLEQEKKATEEVTQAKRKLEVVENKALVESTELTGKAKSGIFGLGEAFMKSAKRVAYYTVTYRALRLAIQAVQDAFKTVVEFDKIMTEIQMVTGKTTTQIQKLGLEYANLAKQVGATTVEVAEASRMWLQQGKTAEEALVLTKASMVMSKVAMIESGQATEYLTATMNAYGITVDKVMTIVDKMASIDMKAAVSTSELAEALSRTANSAEIAGVGLEKVLSYIAVIEEKTRMASSKVGESLKTIFARMGNIKVGQFLSDEGEDLSDVQMVLSRIGVDLISEQTGQFRNFGDVLDEVAGKWKDLTNIEQNAVASALAGTRQRESLIALMSDYDRALELEQEALYSSGFAMQKMTIYMDSIEAKMTDLKNTWKEFAKTLVDSELIKGGISFAKGLLKAIQAIIKVLNSGLGRFVLTLALVLLLVGKLIPILATIKGAKILSSALSGLKAILGPLKLIPILFSKAKYEALMFGKGLTIAEMSALKLQAALGLIAVIATVLAFTFMGIAQAQQEKIDKAKEAYNIAVEEVEKQDELLSKTKDLKVELQEIIDLNSGWNELIALQDSLSETLGRNVNILEMFGKGYDTAAEAARAYLKEVEIVEALARRDREKSAKEAEKQAAKVFEATGKKQFDINDEFFWEARDTKKITNINKVLKAFDVSESVKQGKGVYTEDIQEALGLREAGVVAAKLLYGVPGEYGADFVSRGLLMKAAGLESAQQAGLADALRKELFDKDSDLRKAMYERAEPLGKIYAANFIDSLENASPIMAAAVTDIMTNTILLAENETQAKQMVKNITPALEEINALTNQYVDLLASEDEGSLEQAAKIYDTVTGKIDKLGKQAPFATEALKDYSEALAEALTPKEARVWTRYDMAAEITKESAVLKELVKDYQSLADATQSYFDIRKNILKDMEGLTLEEQRAILGLTDTVTKEVLIGQELDEAGNVIKKGIIKQYKERQADYSAVKDIETVKILQEIDKLYNEYQKDIVNLTDDQLLQNEELTNEYNRQLKMLEMQYAINQKNLEVQKAQIKLANAEAERNTRMFIGGQWMWTANPEAVATAQSEVAKLGLEKNQAILDKEVQEQIDLAVTEAEKLEASLNLWERIQTQVSEHSLEVAESFQMLEKQSDMLSSTFSGILQTIFGKEKYTDVMAELGISAGSFDTGGSLGSAKGWFHKDTSQEEVILNPANTTATKSLLNKLPELENIINKMISGVLFQTPAITSNMQGQNAQGEVYNINNLNIAYKGNSFFEIMQQAKTVAQTQS